MFSHLLDPNTNSTIYIKLFRNVKNVPDLRKQIMEGTLKCCIIKPSLVVDPFQVVIAANKAAVSKKLTTKTIYTELLFNLSISKNITQSLQKFGVDDSETDIIVAVIDSNSNKVDDVFKQVQGEDVDLSLLENLCNRAEIKKTYKLSDVEVSKFSLLDSVISRIAVKDLM